MAREYSIAGIIDGEIFPIDVPAEDNRFESCKLAIQAIKQFAEYYIDKLNEEPPSFVVIRSKVVYKPAGSFWDDNYTGPWVKCPSCMSDCDPDEIDSFGTCGRCEIDRASERDG